MSILATNAITDASGGNTTTINGLTPTVSNMAGRNKIINGSMVFDQRNAGASGTANGYTVDRFAYYGSQASKGTWQQNAGSVTPPTGFKNYLGFTSSSAYSVLSTDLFEIYQLIEGLNCIDLAFGTASASSVTFSFWVRSSLTGTFGGSLANSAGDRAYPFSYTISSANTWEQKSITIAGDTTGTWLTTNGLGIQVRFGLGSGSTYTGTANAWGSTNAIQPTGSVSVVGTNGATFYITGVQLEAGSVATPFEHRQYGQELALCQRYFYYSQYGGMGAAANSQNLYATIPLPTVMRTTPDVALKSGPITVSDLYASGYGTSTATPVVQPFSTGPVSVMVSVQNGWSPGLNTARPLIFAANTSPSVDGAFLISAEL